MLPRKPPRSFITRTIQALIRSFPSQTVRVYRVTPGQNTGGMRSADIETVIYHGEALLIPAGGAVQILALGVLPADYPRLMVAGSWPIAQDDRFIADGNIYSVDDTSDRWKAFGVYKLKQVGEV